MAAEPAVEPGAGEGEYVTVIASAVKPPSKPDKPEPAAAEEAPGTTDETEDPA